MEDEDASHEQKLILNLPQRQVYEVLTCYFTSFAPISSIINGAKN